MSLHATATELAFEALRRNIERRAEQAEEEAARCMANRLLHSGGERAVWKARSLKHTYLAQALRELLA